MKELKIGYLALSKLSWKTPRIEGLARDTAKELAKMESCKLIAPEGLVTSEKEAQAGAEMLAAAGIACLCGAKSPGALIVSAVVTAIGGFNLIGLGVIGEYVGKAYMEAKGRPRAVISERTWHKE